MTTTVSNNLIFVDFSTLPGASEEDLNGLACPICLEEFKKGEEVTAHAGQKPHAYHLVCIQDWLQNKDSCPECRGKITSVNGKDVKELRSSQATATSEIEILSDAAAKGDVERVREVLTDRSPNYWRGIALVKAVQFSCLDLALDEGIEHIEGASHLGVVETVLSSGTISETTFMSAVKWAIYHQNGDLLRTLIMRNNLSEKNRGSAVHRAVLSETLEMLQILLNSGAISMKARGEAIIEAAKINRSDLIKALLEHGPISSEHRELAKEALTDRSEVNLKLLEEGEELQ